MSATDGTGQARPEILDDLGRMLGHVAPLLASAVVVPLLESQRMLLTWYQKMLEDPAIHQATEEYAKALARSLMAACLETLAAQRERREALARTQAELVKSYLDAVDAALKRLTERSDPAGV